VQKEMRHHRGLRNTQYNSLLFTAYYYLAASYSFLGLEDRAAALIFNAIKNCGVDIYAPAPDLMANF
jgi:lipoprotein NlpI